MIARSSDGASDHDLAQRYAPVLSYTTNERFFPISRLDYVAQTDLVEVLQKRKRKRDVVLVDPAPTIGRLRRGPAPCTSHHTQCHWALKVAGLEMRDGLVGYERLQARLSKKRRPTVYWHVVRYGDAFAVQYWFLYLFNNLRQGNWHESDWEQVTVYVEGEPRRVRYSSHNGGHGRDWATLVPETAGRPFPGRSETHPIVYVAKGSHANYFGPELVDVPECRNECADVIDGKGKTLRPVDYALVKLAAPAFCDGDYGSGNFLAGGHVALDLGRIVSEPQTRGAWQDPRAWALEAAVPRDRCPSSRAGG